MTVFMFTHTIIMGIHTISNNFNKTQPLCMYTRALALQLFVHVLGELEFDRRALYAIGNWLDLIIYA